MIAISAIRAPLVGDRVGLNTERSDVDAVQRCGRALQVLAAGKPRPYSGMDCMCM